MIKAWKRRGVVAGAAAGLLLAAALAVYFFAPTLLTVDSGPCVGDVIVVLGGEPSGRPFRALEVFKSGGAKSLLVSGDGDNDYIRNRLVLAGVPPDAIAQEPRSRNTKENAEFSVQWMRDHSITSAVVVTSWYHSRRALACFRHYAKRDIALSSAPAYPGVELRARPSLHELVSVYVEYFKLFWYAVRYGIWPW
jgi:uncharacterized SAM-binding protein YcdF (DUF218 family)